MVAAHLDAGVDRATIRPSRDRVLVSAGNLVAAAADQHLHRLRATLEVADRDTQALFLEVAEYLGDRQLQVKKLTPSADADMYFWRLDFRHRRRGGHEGH